MYLNGAMLIKISGTWMGPRLFTPQLPEWGHVY